MLTPTYQRYADRIRELVDEGQAVARLATNGPYASYIDIPHRAQLHAWLTKAKNIIQKVFGPQSPHYLHLNELLEQGESKLFVVNSVVGLLTGALDDLEKGYLLGQEFIIAGELFDSVLEQARYLNQTGYKDPAAVLVRVVLEDALRRIARREGIDDTQKANKLNEDLRKAGKYPQPQWRLIQSWLDTGNAAAHGKFNEYNQDDVKRLVEDVERFLATELRT
jgi:hypothetical protein